MSPPARRDLLSAASLAVLGVSYSLLNREYSLDTLASPGPGVFPLAVGILMLVLAACLAAACWRARRDIAGPRSESTTHETAPPRSPLPMIGLLVAWVAIVPIAGFFASSFAVVAVSSRFMGATGWRAPIALAIGVTVVAYGLFVRWLGVPLPTGLLP